VTTDNNKKSLVDTFIDQNKAQAQTAIGAGSKRAGGGARMVAFFIDGLILMVAGFLISWQFPVSGMLGFFLTIAVHFLYAGYFYSAHSATPGKMAMNLKVVNESGESLDFMTAGLRDGVGKSISGFILGIGYLMAFFRTDGKALHDLMFKTKVIAG